MHLRGLRQLSRRWSRAARATAGNREAMRRLALEAAREGRAAMPGAWRFPSVEHSFPRWRGFQRARPLARRMGRAGGRRHLPGDELSLLLAAALGQIGRAAARAVAALLGSLSRSHGRPRAAGGHGAVLRLPRARHGESALVPGTRAAIA